MTEQTKQNQDQDQETRVVVPPFCIEADHPRNDNLLIQSVPGILLRSAFDGSKPVIDSKTGESMVPVDQSRHMAAFPKTPGMRLHVNPEKREYVIEDPLYDDKELCNKIRLYFSRAGQHVKEVKGVPMQRSNTDVHRMKTLCREMLRLVKNGHAKVVAGALPTLKDIEQLPGHFLQNPGSQVYNSQPRYEKDMDEWLAKSGMGGAYDG